MGRLPRAARRCARALLPALLVLVAAAVLLAVAARRTANECSNDAGRAAAAAAVRAFALRGRARDPPDPVRPFMALSLSLGALYALHPCVTDRAGDATAAHVAIVVMSAAVRRGRLVRLRRTWGARADAAGARLFLVSDEEDGALGTVVLSGATTPTYEGAQVRSLKGLQHAVAAAPAARWYLLVDDDTHFDAREAVAIVRHVSPRVPVVIGHVVRRGCADCERRHRLFAGTWAAGSAMLLSAEAARAIAGALFTPACPHRAGPNDILLARCAHELHVPFVHHPGFHPELDEFTVADVAEGRRVGDLGARAALHMKGWGTERDETFADAAEALLLRFKFDDAPMNASHA